jgi:hypothetical protein
MDVNREVLRAIERMFDAGTAGHGWQSIEGIAIRMGLDSFCEFTGLTELGVKKEYGIREYYFVEIRDIDFELGEWRGNVDGGQLFVESEA